MSFDHKIPWLQTYLEGRLPHYLDILGQMVTINSFTTNVNGVNELGKLTAEIFAPYGFRAEFVSSARGYGNHLFLHRQAQPLKPGFRKTTLALISHLDTVYSPEEQERNQFYWRIEGERAYGPGCVDIKGGTVMILMILDALQKGFTEDFEQTEWIVALNASEEVLSEDFGRLCLQRFPESTQACLVFEAGNIQDRTFKLVVARKGRAYFHVNVEGRSAHSGNHHQGGANAIVQLAYTIQRLASLTDYERQLTVNVGVVRGGTVVNRVPHFAQAEAELRAFSPSVFDEAVLRVLALEKERQVVSQDGFECRVNIHLIERTDPWPENEATQRLFRLWRDVGARLNMIVSDEKRGGLSDGNHFWSHFPTLDGLGPSGNNAHCSERDLTSGKDQEYVMIPSFVPKALLNTLAISKLIREAKKYEASSP
ncbi:MAG: M20/M25/M40 family metallo-hydrolase [Anaerolineales bacterium]|nr:M20/M25/M40 family metallo-hydrolase [Anaerolineales bacterium]MDW8160745.1 M20/M25/M40 family metallo-hydrolase [Anaerolineales bacterium]